MFWLQSINSVIRQFMFHPSAFVSRGFTFGLEPEPLSTIWPLRRTVSITLEIRLSRHTVNSELLYTAWFLLQPFSLIYNESVEWETKKLRYMSMGLSTLRQILLNATQWHLLGKAFWRDTAPASHPSHMWNSAAVQSHYHLQAGGIGAEDYPCNSQILLDSEPLSQSLLIHFSALHSSPSDPWATVLPFTPHTHSMCRSCLLATTSPCGVYVVCGSSCKKKDIRNSGTHFWVKEITPFLYCNLICHLILFWVLLGFWNIHN